MLTTKINNHPSGEHNSTSPSTNSNNTFQLSDSSCNVNHGTINHKPPFSQETDLDNKIVNKNQSPTEDSETESDDEMSQSNSTRLSGKSKVAYLTLNYGDFLDIDTYITNLKTIYPLTQNESSALFKLYYQTGKQAKSKFVDFIF